MKRLIAMSLSFLVAAGCAAPIEEQGSDALSLESSSMTLANFPNNTGTRLESQSSSDGVVTVNQAYISQHLYGRDLVLDLYVSNLGAEKQIWVVDERDRHSTPVSYASDWWNFNGAASWRFTTSDNKDNVVVRIKGFAHAGQPYAIYVKMNGQTYASRIVLGGE